MGALWYKSRGDSFSFPSQAHSNGSAWESSPGSTTLDPQPSIHCEHTEQLPAAAREGKFSLSNPVSYLGHVYPVVLLCRGKTKADSLRAVTGLLQEQGRTEPCVLGTGRGAVKERDNAWGKEGDCDCLIPAKLAQQRNKGAVLINKSSVRKSNWMDGSSTCISHQTLLNLRPRRLLRSEEPFLPARPGW